MLQRANRELQSDQLNPQLWRDLDRAFRRARNSLWDASHWSLPELSAYCEAALFVTDDGSGLYPDQGPLELLLRDAADLALEHSELYSGPELEQIVSTWLVQDGERDQAHARLVRATHAYRDAPRGLAQLETLRARLEIDSGDLAAAGATIERGLLAATREELIAPAPTPLRGWLESARLAWFARLGLPDHATQALERVRAEFTRWLALADPDPECERVRAQLIFDENTVDLASDRHERVVERTTRAIESSVDPAERAQLRATLAEALIELSLDHEARIGDALASVESCLAERPPDDPAAARLLAHCANLHRRRGEFDAARSALAAARASAGEVGGDRVAIALAGAALARATDAPRADLEACLSDVEAQFDALLEEWAAAPQRSDGIGFLCYGDRRALLCESIALRLRLDGEQRAAQATFASLARVHECGSLHRRLELEPAGDGTRIRSVLCGASRGLVIVLPGSEQSFVLALDADGARIVERPAWRHWRALQRQWVALLTTAPNDALERRRRAAEIARVGSMLREVLLPPAVLELLKRWDEVGVVGWEWIGYLPFESLPVDDSAFGLRWGVYYLPSLTLGRAIAERAVRELSGARVLAAPATPSAALARGWAWDEILWSPRREAALRDLWSDTMVRTGAAATLAALRELCDGSAAVLEIEAHGFYDVESVPPAGFALASTATHDGLTHASDLSGITAPPLVVLAVCGAARGPLRSGDDGLAHLGGAWLGLGADCVAIAAADLRQSSAEALIDVLYSNLRTEGSSVALAARAARRARAAEDPFERDLVHIVGFGPRTVAVQRRAGQLVWIAAGVVGALGLGIALCLRRAR